MCLHLTPLKPHKNLIHRNSTSHSTSNNIHAITTRRKCGIVQPRLHLTPNYEKNENKKFLKIEKLIMRIAMQRLIVTIDGKKKTIIIVTLKRGMKRDENLEVEWSVRVRKRRRLRETLKTTEARKSLLRDSVLWLSERVAEREQNCAT